MDDQNPRDRIVNRVPTLRKPCIEAPVRQRKPLYAPQVLIETEDGRRIWWRADLT
ncbi:hypothetical protein SEA_SPOOKY_103 [Gordonia phage Spooky]|nr:hypothetical protein SEA_SPOOKY_103 [Gordonia phage Spooky]